MQQYFINDKVKMEWINTCNCRNTRPVCEYEWQCIQLKIKHCFKLLQNLQCKCTTESNKICGGKGVLAKDEFARRKKKQIFASKVESFEAQSFVPEKQSGDSAVQVSH